MEKDRTIKVFRDGQEIEVYIKDLSLQEREEADSIRIKRWNKAIQNGAIFAEKLNAVLKEQGIWNEEKQQEIDEVRQEINDCLTALDKGGIKLSDARNLALKVKELRDKINLLSVNRIRYINETVEGQAQNAEFDYIVSQSAVYNSDKDKKYFISYEDYLNRKSNLDSYIIANKIAEVIYGGSEENYTENRFLKEYGFVDEKFRLINKDGHLCDEEGRLIDAWGNLVKIVDGKDVIIDENGKEIEIELKKLPFLDDETGEPIVKEDNADKTKEKITEEKSDGVIS